MRSTRAFVCNARHNQNPISMSKVGSHSLFLCNRYRIDIIFRSRAEDWGVLWALAFHSVWVTALTLIAAALVRRRNLASHMHAAHGQ